MTKEEKYALALAELRAGRDLIREAIVREFRVTHDMTREEIIQLVGRVAEGILDSALQILENPE